VHLTGYFFFSSRRRHTRFSRDWSSDVCSSDLTSWLGDKSSGSIVTICTYLGCNASAKGCCCCLTNVALPFCKISNCSVLSSVQRSEERRVGKEGRSR